MPLSTFYKNKVIDHMFRAQAFTVPTTVYLALFTSATGLDTNSPTGEVSGGTYARMACALDAASGGVTANTSQINFPTSTASWGTVTYVALVDSLTNTNWGVNVNVLAYGALTNAKTVDSGDIVRFDAGEFDFTQP
jgi:hypothetical protein